MTDNTFHGLTASDVRELLLRGHTPTEIAAMRGMRAEALSNFMCSHGVTLTVELHDKPPKPESSGDKVILYPTSISPTSGVRRISRVSLPRITMHVQELEGAP